jgi:hypothetical protein
MSSQNPTIGVNGSGEQILLALHGVIQQSINDNSIGDIILTDRTFHYVVYAQIQDPLKMFGLVGGIISAVTDNSRFESLRREADQKRRALYGLKLNERCSIVRLTPEEIKKLDCTSETNISLQTLGGKQYYFHVPVMSTEFRNAIINWPKSPVLYDATRDPDGYYVGSASQRELLLRMAKGDRAAASEMYQLCSRESYFAIFFNRYLVLDDIERQKILKFFPGAPIEFRNNLLKFARKTIRNSTRNLIIFLVILLMMLLLGLIAVSAKQVGTIIIVLAGLALFGYNLINLARNIKRAKEILASLKTGN